MANYFQPEIETASREKIVEIQNEKIVKQVKHVYENVEYYRKLMDENGVKPEDIKSIDDIKKLPFLSKADLREAYPYGLLGTDLKNCVRIHSTSGTTGKSKAVMLSLKNIFAGYNSLYRRCQFNHQFSAAFRQHLANRYFPWLQSARHHSQRQVWAAWGCGQGCQGRTAGQSLPNGCGR